MCFIVRRTVEWIQRIIQVLIDGKIYTLGGTEDEAYLQKAASYVNEKIATMHATLVSANRVPIISS